MASYTVSRENGAGHRHEETGERDMQSTTPTGNTKLAKGLGLLSIGLGVAGVAAPSRTARLIGVPRTRATTRTLRAVGLRELAAGAGLLSGRRPSGWLWSRVGGDVGDLALLGWSFGLRSANRGRLTATTATVAGITAIDLFSARRVGGGSSEQGIRTAHAITVNRPVETVYAFWRNFENFPRFMAHLDEVAVTGAGRSHWQATGPAGLKVIWDAEITEDVPNERIAWRSLDGADVENTGTVHFKPAPGGRGTEVHVELRYRPPGGAAGAAFAGLFGENPAQQAQDDLRRFKQVMETGEVVLSEATPTGARFSRLFRQRPAQAAERPARQMEPVASR